MPQLATLARLARRLAIPVARAVIAADGEEDLDLWVRARPEGGEVALAIARLAAPARRAADGRAEAQARTYDFIRADADWTWAADATLRLVALSADGMAALAADGAEPAAGRRVDAACSCSRRARRAGRRCSTRSRRHESASRSRS